MGISMRMWVKYKDGDEDDDDDGGGAKYEEV